MASVTVQKWTTTAACGGQVNHMYRTRENYGNKDIRPELESENLYVQTAQESRAAIRDVIAAIDKETPPKRVRTDRKTVAELCIPAPRAEMNREDALRFLQAACEELASHKDVCLVGAAIHTDEVHIYLDPDSKKHVESRIHLHMLVVPNVPGKGCNMKAWLTKSKYHELNAALDRVCVRELGYTYQNGTGAKSRGNVEQMKIASQQAEADKLRQEIAQLDIIRQERQRDAEKAAQDAFKANQLVEKAQSQEKALREEIDKLDIVRELSIVPDNRTLEDAAKSAKKALMGDNVILPRHDFESLVELSRTVWTNHKAVQQIQREKQEAIDRADAAERQKSLVQARMERYEDMEQAYPQVFQEMDRLLYRTDEQAYTHEPPERELEQDLELEP